MIDIDRYHFILVITSIILKIDKIMPGNKIIPS